MNYSNQKSKKPLVPFTSEYNIGPKLYVRRILQKIRLHQVKHMFQQCGKVIDIHLCDAAKVGTFMFLFVTFEQTSYAIKAIQMFNQTQQFGNIIYVNFAKNQPKYFRLNQQCTCICHKTNLILNKKQAKQAKIKEKQYQAKNLMNIGKQPKESEKQGKNENKAITTQASSTVTKEKQAQVVDDVYQYQGKPFNQFELKREYID